MTRCQLPFCIAVLFFLLPAGMPLDAEPDPEFPSASPEYDWSFPEDHGAHPAYRTEWWYFSGIVSTDEQTFGYQFTIFRQRTGAQPASESEWFTSQVYMGHMGVSSLKKKTHQSFVRLARGHPELGTAPETMPGTIRLRDWTCSFDEGWTIEAGEGDTRLSLTLTPTRDILFQGPNGYSQKGPEQGQASHYYSQTRLDTEGTLTRDGTQHTVTGTTWFDHEFGSSQLADNQEGWDWISLRLSDGSDLMIYRLREEGGEVTEQSSATLRSPDGTVTYLSSDEWNMTPLTHWTSPKTRAKYPVKWTVTIPSTGTELTVNRTFDRQEMVLENGLTAPYWEGVIRAKGTHDGADVSGSGFLEMTGYAVSMDGSF